MIFGGTDNVFLGGIYLDRARSSHPGVCEMHGHILTR